MKSSIIKKYFILSIAFGAMMGIIFPIYAYFFVTPKSQVFGIIFIAGCIVAGLLVGLFSYLIGYLTIINTIKIISKKMSYIIDNKDFSESLAINSNDYLGEMIENFNRLVELIDQILHNISTKSINLNDTAHILSDLSKKMNTSIGIMTGTTNTIASSTHELNTNMQMVAKSAKSTNANIRLVSNSTISMADTFLKISENSDKAFNSSQKAQNKIEDTVKQISILNSQSDEVEAVIEQVTKIADQIKLLALNATIEAERAGDAGRGFAVVANEVKDLSQQTNKVVDKVHEKLKLMKISANTTLKDIQELNYNYKDLFEIINQINSTIGNQNETSKHIAENIKNATENVEDVTRRVVESAKVIQNSDEELNNLNNSSLDSEKSSREVSETSDKLFILSDQLHAIVKDIKI